MDICTVAIVCSVADVKCFSLFLFVLNKNNKSLSQTFFNSVKIFLLCSWERSVSRSIFPTDNSGNEN